VFLFGLLGGALNLNRIPLDILGKAVIVIVLGLPFRGLVAYYCAAVGGKWSQPDRIFTAISWMPKATVQAALSTVALQYVEAREASYESTDAYDLDRSRSMIILAAATISIVLTAPTGAIAIGWSGPRLLTQSAQPIRSDVTVEIVATYVTGCDSDTHSNGTAMSDVVIIIADNVLPSTAQDQRPSTHCTEVSI
jgi:hypothetical protein